MPSISSRNNQASSGAVFGITRAGQPCKKCIQVQRFCHFHRSQERPQPATSYIQVFPQGRSASSPGVGVPPSPSFNVGSRDDFCPPCIRLGKDCTYHAFQKSPTSTTFGVTSQGNFCKNCTSMGGFCQQHQVQQERERQAVSSQRPGVFGITLRGTPCKICLVKGDFCKKHESQRGRQLVGKSTTTTTTISPQMRDQASPEEVSGAPPPTVYGLTVKGAPCKICLRKGDFCGWHESQRQSNSTVLGQERLQTSSSSPQPTITVYGVTVKGTPCKICIREGDFCHFHVDQKPLNNDTTTPAASSTPTTFATPFVVTKKGTPCKLCVQKGDLCRLHEATPVANVDPAMTSISRRHQVRRTLSLLLLAALLQYAVFVGLLDGTPMVRTLQENVVDAYNGIKVDSILEGGVQTYHNMGINSMIDRCIGIKDAALHHDWVKQAGSWPMVQTLMNAVQWRGGGGGGGKDLERIRYHQDLMEFVTQSNITYPMHSDLSEVELN